MTYGVLPRASSEANMAMINYTVYSQHRRRTLLTWRIAAVNPPSATFRSFYNGHVRGMVCGSSSGEIDISDVFVGQSKENLDSVDSGLVIADVVSVFGRFVKYAVGQAEAVGHQVEFMKSSYIWGG